MNLALLKEGMRQLLKKKVVKDFLTPLTDAVVQDAIDGTTPARLFDAIGDIIKGQIWKLVKAGPLKLLAYLNKSTLLMFIAFLFIVMS